jgi:peptide/nickel transport system substrate-binding protein
MKALLVSVLTAASLLGASGAAAKAPPNVLVFGLNGDVAGGFNAALSCCDVLPGAFVDVPVLHGAFVQNDEAVWVKDLVSSAHADTRGLSYTIRPDAYWYWGGKKIPVTYRDFVYTLRELDDPANDISSRLGYANLDPTHFTHRGDRQVTLFWRTTNCSADLPCGPFAPWPELFSPLYPSVALAGLDFNTIWTNCICGSDGKPVANGPFYLASYVRGQGAVLKANPYYYERPKLAEVDFKVLGSDPGVLTEAMRDGRVDAIYPSFAPELLTVRSLPGLRYRVVPQFGLEYIQFREGSARGGPGVTKGASNALLRAPWMRQAIALALNRQKMIDAIYGSGSGLKPSNSLLFYPGEAGYRADFARWNYNPSRAVTLLRQHCTGGPSVPDPGTDKVWRCSGLPATFGYTWPSTSPPRTQIEQLAKANLKAVGIEIVDRPLPSPAVFDQVATGDFDLAQYATFTTGDAGDWYDSFRCFGAANYTGYCSHTVDGVLKTANGELDPAKRALLFERADAVMAAAVVEIPLFQKPGALIQKSAIQGMGPSASLLGPFWNIQDWHWKG